MKEAALVARYYVVAHRYIYVPVAVRCLNRGGEVDLSEDRVFLEKFVLRP